MGQCVGARDQGNSAKNAKTCSYCDITSRKPQTQSEKNFFLISTRGLAESLEGLNSSLAAGCWQAVVLQSFEKNGARGTERV